MKVNENSSIRKFMHSLCLILLILVSGMDILSAQDTTETVIVTEPISITNIGVLSTRSKGLSGIMITLTLEDTLTINGNLNVAYSLNEKSYTRDIRNMYVKKLTEIRTFHPYAQLFEKSGDHRIVFALDSIYDPDAKIGFVLKGNKMKPAVIEVPTLHSIKVKVNYTEVSSTTRKGKAWDFNFFANTESDNYPDLIFIISSPYNEDSNGVFTGQFYRSHKQKNTLIASWPYFSDIVYYCEGDELFLYVKDADNVFHDTIGYISLDELKGKEKIEDMHFGQVLRFSCEVEEN